MSLGGKIGREGGPVIRLQSGSPFQVLLKVRFPQWLPFKWHCSARWWSAFVLGSVLSAQDTIPSPEAPPPGATAFSEVSALFGKGNFAAARALVDKRVADGVLSKQAACELRGFIEIHAKDFAAAEGHFAEWVSLESKSVHAWFNLGESRFLQKHFEEAIVAFEAAVTIAAETARFEIVDLAQYKKVLSLLGLKKPSEAGELVSKMEPREGSPAKHFAEMAILYRSGEMVKARDLLRQCADSFPPQLNDLYFDSFLELGWAKRGSDGIPALVEN